MIKNHDPEKNSKEMYCFYSNLYSSSHSRTDADAFLDHIKDWIPTVDESFKNVCDADISMRKWKKQ